MTKRRITVIVENTCRDRGLLGEHGLSFWIELGSEAVLFDTGQGQVIKHNAQRLGVKLASTESIALSHGHYDHTGGLSDVLALTGHPRVYAHPQAFEPKYACNANGLARDVGTAESAIRDVRSRAEMIPVTEPVEIGAGLWLTGPVPRLTAYEDTGGAFFKDKDCHEPDDLVDDQAAFFETESGTVVILGCAHSGVINTLRHIRTLTSNRPIRAALGGMHLVNAGPERINATIEELRSLEVASLAPCHCTGFPATARLWREFSDQCRACPAGSVIAFDD